MKDYNTYQDNSSIGKYDLYVGLDVDKSSISVSVNDGHKFINSLKIPHDPSNLLSFIEKNYSGKKVKFVYEAGPTGFGLYDSIVGANYDCLVVSPGSIPNAPNNRVKTNRLDSKKLAALLSGNQLKGIHVPPESIRQLRALVQLRYTYMQDIRAYKCRIKAELLKEGIDFPRASKGSQWTKAVIKQLRNLDCAAPIDYKINSLLNHLEHLNKQMLMADFAVKGHVNGNDDLKRCIEYLRSCPGIGWRIACYTLARFGDWKCLGVRKQAGAFFGLVPTENSTGDRTDRGSITKCGDPRLRSMLVQGAWIAIRTDSELKAIYNQICASHSVRVGARVAIVAIARKLAERMHCVLKEQRKYEFRVTA